MFRISRWFFAVMIVIMAAGCAGALPTELPDYAYLTRGELHIVENGSVRDITMPDSDTTGYVRFSRMGNFAVMDTIEVHGKPQVWLFEGNVETGDLKRIVQIKHYGDFQMAADGSSLMLDYVDYDTDGTRFVDLSTGEMTEGPYLVDAQWNTVHTDLIAGIWFPEKPGEDDQIFGIFRKDGTRVWSVEIGLLGYTQNAFGWSQDGEKLAIGLGDSVYVVNKDGTGGHVLSDKKFQFSASRWSWSPDGKTLAFIDADQRINLMNYQNGAVTKLRKAWSVNWLTDEILMVEKYGGNWPMVEMVSPSNGTYDVEFPQEAYQLTTVE